MGADFPMTECQQVKNSRKDLPDWGGGKEISDSERRL